MESEVAWVATAAIVSSLAFFLSLWASFRSMKIDKRNLLLLLHGELTRPDVQDGRYILSKEFMPRAKRRKVVDLPREKEIKINHALSQFDILGFYCNKGYVSIDDALELWATPLVQLEVPSGVYMNRRLASDAQRGAVPLWPHFRAIQCEAKKYLSSRSCTARASRRAAIRSAMRHYRRLRNR